MFIVYKEPRTLGDWRRMRNGALDSSDLVEGNVLCLRRRKEELGRKFEIGVY